MIEKMKVVHIVAAASEKTALLDKLRELGVVHFAEKASADQQYLERFARLSRMEMTLQEYPKAKQEMTVLKSKNTNSAEQKRELISKDTMKQLLGRSPDFLDMLIMRMIFEIKPKATGMKSAKIIIPTKR